MSLPAFCPSCGGEGARVFSQVSFEIMPTVRELPKVIEPYKQKGRAKFKDTPGGGKQYLLGNGNYRPALTHTAYCPQEKRRRNVAIVAKLGNRIRLNCTCGWQWMYEPTTAEEPLMKGFDRSLLPGETAGSHYNQAEGVR